MATKAEAWRAETDGTLHSNEKAATEHDIDVLADRILANPAKDPSIGLKDHADEAIRLLTAYVKAHPGAGGGKVPSQARKGPAARQDPPHDPDALVDLGSVAGCTDQWHYTPVTDGAAKSRCPSCGMVV